MENALLRVGPTVEAVVAAREAILMILNAPNEEATIQAALKAFVEVCSVKDTTISDCHFSGAAE